MTTATAAPWTSVNGTARKFTQEEMHAAFSAVQDKANWKRPIPEQAIPSDALLVTVAAIAHFAGSPTHIRPNPDGTWQIKAPGYYACIGA